MNSELHIKEIINCIKREVNTTDIPLISRSQWNQIPKTPFTVLISCLLSLRTKDEITEQVSIRLLKIYHTPEKIKDISEQELEKIIYPVGFYKTKAKRIKEISKTILKEYQGNVPDNFETLLTLKGVGRKTANIVMVYGFNKQGYLPIDTHCHRIPNRLGWITTKTPEETERKLREILPKKYWTDFNHLFVVFGQTICKPISPHCSTCPINKYCKQRSVTKHR
ncbi:MAG: endonuclease III [Thermoplasmata archaeon]|nr:MAG: endonuclease III [Thermoplasmata archaeon]